ncbi:MAG: DUF115 domain-containing protein [Treponema sp.]|nr:DUF115 domain-containing protein [Treponema sp.]
MQERFKKAEIIALHIGDFPAHHGTVSINSGKPDDIQKFLETHIPETNTDRIRIIEWRPSLNYYRESYAKLLSQVVQYIKRTDAVERTTAAFGKRWVRNFFKNIENIKDCLLYKETSVPVIITGSGPSLEKALPVIKNAQNRCLIIAASSSLTALYHNSICPDFIIATDGGSWALRHLYSRFRGKTLNETPSLALNLCAALPSQCASLRKLIINDGSLWQSIVLHKLALASVIIPQRGTVTASAVDLALILSGGNIYLAGMDFSFADIMTHVKPYNFDSLFWEQANRFTPFYSEIFSRSFLMSQGGSMDIYASWFKNQLDVWEKRIFYLGGSKLFNNGETLLESYLKSRGESKNLKNNFKTAGIKKTSSSLCEDGIQSLLCALKEPQYADKLKEELTALLFPREKTASEQDIKSALNEIAHNTRKASYG